MTDMDQSGNVEYEVENFDIYEFLVEYEKRPELWDKNHQFYRNKLIRLESEKSLCKKLQIPDLRALRRKIRSVRGSYNAVIGKVRESLQTSGGEMYVTRLSWFPAADRFLRTTTDIPNEIEIPMELRLQNTISEPVSVKTIKKTAKPHFFVADSRSLMNEGNNMTPEILIEDGTYSYEELETTEEQEESYVNDSGEEENASNYKIDNFCSPEYIIADENDVHNSGDGTHNMNEEYLELDSSSEEANTGRNVPNPPRKKQKKERRYIIQNQIRSYRLDNCKPYGFKNRLLNKTAPVPTAEKESGRDNILNYLKDIMSESENEFVAFGKSIGVQLSKMPAELAIQLQSDIQRHVTKVRLNYLKEHEDDVETVE